MQPSRSWYLSDLALHLDTPKTSLQRELANLEGAGIIRRRVIGRQVHYQADPACPFLPELQGLLAKTSGLVDVMKDALNRRRSRVSFAFIYGSVARGEEVAESDVDLLVVGEVGLSDLALPIRQARERLGREVNPTVMSPEEFAVKAGEKGFVRTILDRPKLFVVGDDDVVERTLGTAPRRSGKDDARRNRVAEGPRSTRDRGRVG